MRSTMRLAGSALIVAVTALVAVPRAAAQFNEPAYLVFEGGATGPLNEPARVLFNLGGDVGFGVYQSLVPWFAVGGRVRTGVLSEGSMLPQHPVNYGLLDYGMLSVPLRFRPLAHVMPDNRRATGLFLEAAPGISLVDGDVIPAYEAALGYNFDAGPIAIGPMFRFTHFIETNGRFNDNHILTWMGGLQVAFLDSPYVRAEPVADLDIPAIEEREEEITLDVPEPRAPERFANDALIVDERVFFDFDEAELRDAGKAQLDIVVQHYRQYGDRYQQLVIEGHADHRGAIPYNEDLSMRRARAVQAYLTERGVPARVLAIEAWGEVDPAIGQPDTEWDHQVNRRVEFRVEWQPGRRPPGEEPVAQPTMPDRVDEAPTDVQRRERLARVRAREQREREIARTEREERNERIARARTEREGAVATTGVDVDVEQQPQARR